RGAQGPRQPARAERIAPPAEQRQVPRPGLPEVRSVLVAQAIRDLSRGERPVREELGRELAAMGIAELAIRRAGFPEPAAPMGSQMPPSRPCAKTRASAERGARVATDRGKRPVWSLPAIIPRGLTFRLTRFRKSFAFASGRRCASVQ